MTFTCTHDVRTSSDRYITWLRAVSRLLLVDRRFLRLGILLGMVFSVHGALTGSFGQVAIPLSQLNPQWPKKESANHIKAFDGQLLAGVNQRLWILSQDGRRIDEVEGIKGNVVLLQTFGDRMLVSTDATPLAILDKSRNVIRVKGFEYPRIRIWEVQEVGDQFFIIGTNVGLMMIGRHDTEAHDIENFDDDVINMMTINDRLYAITRGGSLWILSNNGARIDQLQILTGVSVLDAKAVGDQIFLRAQGFSLWSVSKDGKHVKLIENFKEFAEFIDSIHPVNEQLFVGTHDGGTFGITEESGRVEEEPRNYCLWRMSRDGGRIDKVAMLDGEINIIRMVGELLFVGTTEGFWILSDDGKQAFKVPSVQGSVDSVEPVGEYTYINGAELYQLNPRARISSKLTPSGWWAAAIALVLPSTWLPAEKVQASSSYSDENGNDPYDANLPREFRFAKADGDATPADDSFSTKEQFGYEIGWGRNEVAYWVKDKWGNTFLQKATYVGVPSQYFFAVAPFILSAVFVLGCFAFAPKVDACHGAIMNPWLRKYFSLGSVPLLLSAVPALRRHILRRYAKSINKDKEFAQWKDRFVFPDEEFLPKNFGKKLNAERRLLLTGQSGIGKTSFFKYLTAYYAAEDNPTVPAKVFPVYVPLTNYGGNSLEDLVYNQLFSYGKITDKELAPMFLEQGGLLIFLDGINEVQNVSDRQKLSAFVERHWTSNYICLSSQQSYPEFENITKVELKTFSKEQVCKLVRTRVNDQEKAESAIAKLSGADYQLYSLPRDLELAIEILNGGEDSLPTSRTELYKTTFSSIFAKWGAAGDSDSEEMLYQRAYTMITQKELAFDSIDDPKFNEITIDLLNHKFLVQRERKLNFRHELIRSYLASEYFYPRWKNLLEGKDGKPIDSNWLEMLKFSCEYIADPGEVKSLVYEVLDRSVRKDLVRNLFEWVKTNHPGKCNFWEKDFYAKYGELDFK